MRISGNIRALVILICPISDRHQKTKSQQQKLCRLACDVKRFTVYVFIARAITHVTNSNASRLRKPGANHASGDRIPIETRVADSVGQNGSLSIVQVARVTAMFFLPPVPSYVAPVSCKASVWLPLDGAHYSFCISKLLCNASIATMV